MLPRTAIISHYLAREYERLLQDALLVRVEYERATKLFHFAFHAEQKWQLRFSFSPPDFVLLPQWSHSRDSFEIWLECSGSRVLHVAGPPDNRIVSLEMEKETGMANRRFRLVFELFGSRTNALLLDENERILQATRVVHDRRALKPGLGYQEPEALAQTDPGVEVRIGRSARTEFWLVPNEKQHNVVSRGEAPDPGWDRDPEYPLISVHRYLHEIGGSADALERSRTQLTGWLQREIKRLERLTEQVCTELEQCDAAPQFKQWGDILLANSNAQASGDAVTLFDFYQEKETEIPLPPGKGIVESANHYYKKAGKLSRAPGQLKRRLRQLTDATAKYEAELRAALAATEPGELERIREKSQSLAQDTSIGRGPRAEVGLPYRAFKSSAGERILVGRSARDNDALTFKIARTYDYWFHAQQARGSHVILVVSDKNREPSRRSIEEAAALAAYYSESRKSSNVPVMYARRRHVRKARKGPPGKVITERVESIFVDPRKAEPSANNSG